MRADLQHEVDAYVGDDQTPAVWASANPDAYRLWASTDGATVVVTTKSDPNADGELAVHDGSGTVHNVKTGTGLPIVRWVSASGDRIVFQQFNGQVFVAPIDGSAAPTRLDAIPSGADAISEPSSQGVVAYSGGDSASSNVCFANDVPADALN